MVLLRSGWFIQVKEESNMKGKNWQKIKSDGLRVEGSDWGRLIH